jgi:hypothetical protein
VALKLEVDAASSHGAERDERSRGSLGGPGATSAREREHAVLGDHRDFDAAAGRRDDGGK